MRIASLRTVATLLCGVRRAIATTFTVLIFLVCVATPVLAQALAEPSELERLRAKNRELRARLQQAEAKLKATQARPTSTPGVAKPASPTKPPPSHDVAAERFVPQSVLDKVYLRKSVFSEDILDPSSISSPAQFTFEHSAHGADSYAIDTGVAAEFITIPLPQSQIDWGIGLDYHRSSSSESPKNLLQTGTVADSFFGDPALSSFFAHIKANVSFKDDERKDVKSVAGALDVLPVEKMFFKIDDPHDLGVMRWRWQPFAGFRWAASTDVPGGSNNGHQFLARYGLESQFFPLYSFAGFKDSLEATLNLTAWSDISSSGVYRNTDWRGFLDFNLTYWFNGGPAINKQKTSLGFGLGYEKGDNPDSDETDVDQLTLSLKAKF